MVLSIFSVGEICLKALTGPRLAPMKRNPQGQPELECC
ncbi:hypothetical protein VDTJJZMW_CDS_0191 [Pseudomonas phage LPS-5]|uniref:Uncharacterized protein n=1 Tax=Pseudomonas phage PaP1 TaxID=685892 RepID=A0A068NXL8_9CAUD|nr:hypothetical protein PaP1_gp160 [Pseudomonas phage PaP1]AIE90108.1 hypothetical protein PaP1_gp160 [Pseudomonas phage PaP1]